MKTVLYLLTITLLLTSCRTVLTRQNDKINISTNAKDAKVKIFNSTYQLPTTINLIRYKKDLYITLVLDNAAYKYIIRTKNPDISFGRQPTNLIDLTKQKSINGEKSVFLDVNDTNKIAQTICKLPQKQYDLKVEKS